MLVSRWNKYLEYFREDQADIYFLEEYLSLYETEGSTAFSYIYQEGQQVFLFPFLRNSICIHDEIYFDFESVYGYSGPIANTSDIDFIQRSMNNLILTLKNEKYIAGFIRFSPLLNNSNYVNQREIRVSKERDTVAVDLTFSEKELWETQIHPKHRNVIRKAEKLGLQYIADDEYTFFNEFKEMYRETMVRQNADHFYFFNDAYFDALKEKLYGKSFLGVVLLNDIVIAGAIFFFFGQFGHYHLSGSRTEYLNYYPNNFLIYHTMLHMKQHGITLFHLGGGTDSTMNNSLYKFKKRFSQKGLTFHVGRAIIDQDKYREACDQWSIMNPDKTQKYSQYHLKYKF